MTVGFDRRRRRTRRGREWEGFARPTLVRVDAPGIKSPGQNIGRENTWGRRPAVAGVAHPRPPASIRRSPPVGTVRPGARHRVTSAVQDPSRGPWRYPPCRSIGYRRTGHSSSVARSVGPPPGRRGRPRFGGCIQRDTTNIVRWSTRIGAGSPFERETDGTGTENGLPRTKSNLITNTKVHGCSRDTTTNVRENVPQLSCPDVTDVRPTRPGQSPSGHPPL